MIKNMQQTFDIKFIITTFKKIFLQIDFFNNCTFLWIFLYQYFITILDFGIRNNDMVF